MTHLEEFQKKGSEASAKKSGGSLPAASQPGVITYQLNYRPEQVKLAQSTRAAELEQRLYKLEAAVGTTPELMVSTTPLIAAHRLTCSNIKLMLQKKLSVETHEKSLLEAVHTLSAKLALLEPAHVEHVDALLTALGVKMDNLAEKAAAKGQADLERDKKVCYILKKVKWCAGFVSMTSAILKAWESKDICQYFYKSIISWFDFTSYVLDQMFDARYYNECIRGRCW